MKIQELEEKVKNSQDAIEKRKSTIERQNKQLDKKREIAIKLGADLSKTSADYAGGKNNDIYWAMCDVSWKEEEIKSSYTKLRELEIIHNNWVNKFEEAQSKSNVFVKELPKVMKDCQAYLVEQWDEWDLEHQKTLTEIYKNCSGYYEFRKSYSEEAFQMIGKTKEQIHESNMRNAEYALLDLYCRIKEKTGRVTSWKYLKVHLGHLNGRVIGVDGEVKVESILAGGHNIQRLHIRTLVHKQKEPETTQSYQSYSIEELEKIASTLGITPKKYDNVSIYRMRMIMAIKAAK